MKSCGKFRLEVQVPPEDDAQQRANDIMMLMREEIADPNDFLDNLEEVCENAAKFLSCELEMEENDGILLARFIFKEE